MMVNDRGFTVVEVVLFLGITGLMLLGVFAGTNTLIANSRFQDSIFNLESYLQRQSEQAWNGVNPRTNIKCSGSKVTSGNDTPGTSNCLLLGRVVIFRPSPPATTDQANVVEAYDVVGSEPSVPTLGLTNDALLKLYDPQTVPVSVERYEMPWGTYFRSGRRGASAVNAIAFLRSPTSSRQSTYHFQTADAGTSEIPIQSYINSANSAEANYCVNGVGGPLNRYRAAINFGVAQGSGSIRANLNASAGSLC